MFHTLSETVIYIVKEHYVGFPYATNGEPLNAAYILRDTKLRF